MSESRVASENAAFIIGISGPSSSGKTTLARLLRDIIPGSFILHEDDFYLPDQQIPLKPGTDIQDWDCLESLDTKALESALKHIRSHGTLPPNLVSKEDQNAVGESGVSVDLVRQLRKRFQQELGSAWEKPVAIIDGFLFYSKSLAHIRPLFDVKLFLRTSYQTAKKRREARSGYVTLEGFWEDPPGYVDEIVWPNYVKDHAFLFKDGNVEGEMDEALCRQLDIDGMPSEAEGNMAVCLQWAFGVLGDKLRMLPKTQP